MASIHDDFYNDIIKLNPLSATYYGDHRYDDKYTHSATKKYKQKAELLISDYLEKIKHEKDDILIKLMKYELELEKEAMDLPFHYIPMSHLDNPFKELLEIVDKTLLNEKNPLHLAKFKKRVISFIEVLPELKQNMIDGTKVGICLNKECTKILIHDLKELKISSKFVHRSKRKEFKKFMQHTFMIEVKKFIQFLERDYLPYCKESLGLYGYAPIMEKMYRFCMKHNINDNIGPDELFDIGMKEIKKIDRIKKSLGVKDIYNKDNLFKNEKEMVDAYSKEIDKLIKESVQFFDIPGRKPKIVKINSKYEPAATFWPPDIDLKRPGIFKLNVRDALKSPISDVRNLTAHEVIAHNYQLYLVMANKKLPKWTRLSDHTSTVEGWALYVESLFLHENPSNKFELLENYSTFNSLQIRATRLCIDIGIHHKGWDFEKCFKFMKKYLYDPDEEITAEIYRYAILPGQSLSYYSSYLRINKMRDKFINDGGTLKEFNNMFLSLSYLPINFIEDKMNTKC